MSFRGEALFDKTLPARLDKPTILSINIANKEPCTDTVRFQSSMEKIQDIQIDKEGLPSLHVRGCRGRIHQSEGPHMLIAIVPDNSRVIHRPHLCTLLQIEPYHYLRAIKGWLLDVRDGTGITLLDNRNLVSGITKEIAFENNAGTQHILHFQEDFLRLLNTGYLPFEKLTARLHMQHGMQLLHFTCREARPLYPSPYLFKIL